MDPTPAPGTPSPEGDGVRRTPVRGPSRGPGWLALGALALVAAAVLWFNRAPVPMAEAPVPAAVAAPAPAAVPATLQPVRLPEAPPELPSLDTDDLAAHYRPGDPVPTGAELIGALHEAGIRTGIGAFNPPGTSPPLEGLAVPEDFDLPPGYLRHHQYTDDGQAIEAILMFAPGFELRDAAGRRLPMPANGVVPPEYAPPGLPLRRVRIPNP